MFLCTNTSHSINPIPQSIVHPLTKSIFAQEVIDHETLIEYYWTLWTEPLAVRSFFTRGGEAHQQLVKQEIDLDKLEFHT